LRFAIGIWCLLVFASINPQRLRGLTAILLSPCPQSTSGPKGGTGLFARHRPDGGMHKRWCRSLESDEPCINAIDFPRLEKLDCLRSWILMAGSSNDLRCVASLALMPKKSAVPKVSRLSIGPDNPAIDGAPPSDPFVE
jgi:hypothetical protein